MLKYRDLTIFVVTDRQADRQTNHFTPCVYMWGIDIAIAKANTQNTRMLTSHNDSMRFLNGQLYKRRGRIKLAILTIVIL